jgi:hypothetical protein
MTDYTLLHVYDETPGGLSFTARFYQGDVNVTGGGGGFISVPRPQRHPITIWHGSTDSYAMEIPLIFDATNKDTEDVEHQCRTVEQMAGVLGADFVQPPVLILDANGALENDVINRPSTRWVIPDPPVWGDRWRRNSDGKRVRQCVTIKFMHYVAADVVHRHSQPAPSTHSVYAKANDTYSKIAARELKKYGGIRWGNRLAQLNGARDGAEFVLPGKRVKLPTVAQIKQWEGSPRR